MREMKIIKRNGETESFLLLLLLLLLLLIIMFKSIHRIHI